MWRNLRYDENTGVRCMINLPIVLIVLEIRKRAADTKAAGSFHGYSYSKKYVKVKGKCLPNVYDKFLLLKYINIYRDKFKNTMSFKSLVSTIPPLGLWAEHRRFRKSVKRHP